MAHLVALLVSQDDSFHSQIGRLLRSTSIPVSVIDERVARDSVGASADVVVVDARNDPMSAASTIERLRGSSPSVAIFAVALAAEPDLILRTMRAGANEFFTWPPDTETFHTAIRRTASRRDSAQGARPPATTLVFFGAKGGAGTTTVAVNCGVELARLSKRSTVILDLKPGLGEVALFLGLRPRFTLLDAIDNLTRADREFLRELAVTHKSGLDILAGSEHFDRPSGADGAAIEELLRLLTKQYDYIVVDGGSQINSCTVSSLYTADQLFLVANPDVPSIRNAQRLLDRVRQLGAVGDRVRVLLNRASSPLPIPQKQIEGALGHPIHHTFPNDYKTVSSALNSGVPLALTGDTELAAQFDKFTQGILGPFAEDASGAGGRKSMLPLERIASLW